MPRKSTGTYDNRAYQNDYHKAMKSKLLSFNPANPDDMEMWDHLMSKDNSTRYIKGLIREDMERRN